MGTQRNSGARSSLALAMLMASGRGSLAPRRPALWAAVLCATLALPTGGCALGGSGGTAKAVVRECVLPANQASTITGRWRITPIPIALHDGGNWQPDEIADVTRAADSWNAFYQTTRNMKVLDYGTSAGVRLSSQPVPASMCATGIVQGNQYAGQVVLYKQGKWPHPSGAQGTIALTSSCTDKGTKPFPTIYNAYMEINYQYFFVSGRRVPDLQTIVAHEFGHLLGLLHSCDAGVQSAGKTDCNSAGLDPSYVDALMFPTFGFIDGATGEQKRDLASNDQGRANCIYPTATPSQTPTGSAP